jgi:hypothetical protein
VHPYSFGGTTPRAYYFTWCDGLVPDGIAILRWEREGAERNEAVRPRANAPGSDA